MSDSPGTASVLGIEAVEWFSEGGENLTVRVTGRWRRRRPAWSGQPVLVIESSGRRHRFPAMPDPPSLAGAGPGMWRLSFAVPAVLAPELGGCAWLQFGTVVVQLPAAVEPFGGRGDDQDEDGSSSELLPPGGRPPGSELEIEALRRRAREAEDAAVELTERVRVIERELEAARIEAGILSASLTERDAARRSAEQRAHAEQALRRDLARQLAARTRESGHIREALGELATAEDRIRELETELRAARRRGDEAEQAAAAAGAARERVERQARDRAAASLTAAQAADRAVADERDRLGFERGLLQRRGTTGPRIPFEPSAIPVSRAGPAPPAQPAPPVEPAPSGVPSPPASPAVLAPPFAPEPAGLTTPGHEALIAALRRELDARASAEAALRSSLVDARARLDARPLLERRTGSTLGLLRGELDGLRSAFAVERAARLAAEQRLADLSRDARGRRERSREIYAAIAELRHTLEALRAPAPESEIKSEPASQAAERVVPERLNDARVRLRETIAPPESADAPPETADAPQEPADATVPDATAPDVPTLDPTAPDATPVRRTGRPWLEPVFRALARTDPASAGRLLLDLLPAQHEVFPDPVVYDLVLGDPRGSVRVTARDGEAVVRHAEGPRPAGEVDFQVFGEPAVIARLLTAGPLRRILRRGLARVRGRRDRVAALRALVEVRLDLLDLHRAGVRLEPLTVLKILSLAIEPGWTVHERFTLAYTVDGAATAYLLVRDGRRLEVADEAPTGRVATTISGPAEALAAVLSGESGELVTVIGDDWPLALLRKWIKRAQSE